MLQYGEPPYLECSTQGDKRFSPFCARIEARNARTIESIYQAAKVFKDGTTNLDWRRAKGRKAINQEELKVLYSQLWDEYIAENLWLLPVLKAQTGLSDMFGKEGNCCQVTELWRIRNAQTTDSI